LFPAESARLFPAESARLFPAESARRASRAMAEVTAEVADKADR